MLLKRYGNIDFINNLELIEFIRLLKLIIDKEKEEALYKQWCAMLPKLAKYMSFNEFSDSITGKNIDTRPAEDIIKEVEGIKSRMEK